MRKFWFGVLVAALSATFVAPAHALIIPRSFEKYAKSPALADAGIIVMDPTTQEPIFSDQPDSLRAPASVLKLLSTTTAVRVLGADTTFKTSVYQLAPKEFALVGESDPWLTASKFEAGKYHRAFSPYLINKILQAYPNLHTITLKSYGVYQTDIKLLQQYFRHRLLIKTQSLSAAEVSGLTDGTKLGEISSPSVSDIVKFTLLWSDNILADRLARTAAKKAGFATDETGIQNVFEATLNTLQIPATGLQVFDGNGLSHDDRVSPRTIADLLVKIKDNPTYQPVIEGLPTAGKTGTLKNRFVKDAPTAVGLVKAKTGWINNSVALAGYVNVGNQKYVFAVIADHVKPYEVYRAQAREAIDKMLGTIATPPTNN